MSTRIQIKVNNKTPYILTLYKRWGEKWVISSQTAPPPETVKPGEEFLCGVDDNNRAGLVYLAKDSLGNEKGYITMSFTCPKSSSNSAEGSPNTQGAFIQAGLQQYDKHGDLSLVYNLGDKNLACWDSGDSNDGEIECEQTTLETWARVILPIENTTEYTLKFVGKWGENWEILPTDLPVGAQRIYLLNDNDRAGLYYRAMDNLDREISYVTMSFTCPKSSSNSAEGSPYVKDMFLQSGLQTYKEHGTPVIFSYEVGTENLACWDSGNSNDGEITCDETELNGRAKILVYNDNDYDLKFIDKWDESGGNDAWYFDPTGIIPSNSHKLLVLNTYDRAGVYYNAENISFHLSFTCPKSSSNSAEGSAFCGLQTYEEHGTPVNFTYNIGTPNKACWDNGSSDDGKIVCSQTIVHNKPFPREQVEEALLNANFSKIAKLDESDVTSALSALSPSYKLEKFFENSETDTQGFLAYSKAAKSIVLSFRGTLTLKDVDIDLYQEQVPLNPGLDPNIKVVKGFDLAYTSIENEVMDAINLLLTSKDIPISDLTNFYVTGHSLGGALATIGGLQTTLLLKDAYSSIKPEVLKTITMAAPPVGNQDFRTFFQNNLSCLAYRLIQDNVANGVWTVDPGIVIDFAKWDYQQAGTVCTLESNISFPDAHYLSNYISFLEKLLGVTLP